MRLRPPLRVSVTRHEDKEHKLRAFILDHIAAAQDAAGTSPRRLLVVARSADSPLVKAVGSIAEEIGAAAYSVRLILAYVDHEALPAGWAPLGHARGFEHEIRWARRPRLIEAHEQLVLGPHTCWIGDCMRRDPNKCDAYESYVEDCGEAAGCATVSFERLWEASEPLVTHPPRAPIAGAVAGGDGASPPSVGTRH